MTFSQTRGYMERIAMKSLLNAALMFTFLASPVIASDDAPSCPSCPKKGDKEQPAALVLGCECAKCECKDCKGDCCGKKKPAAPAHDCDVGCKKGKKKECDKDDCAASQDDCGGCKKGKKKGGCDKEEAPAAA